MSVDYALAPIGATHFYICEVNFFWLKKSAEGEVWFFYNHACSEWLKCVASEEPKLVFKIPEREIAINRYVDENDEWPLSGAKGLSFLPNPDSEEYVSITKEQYDRRLAERLEAGLIKQNNDLADVNDNDVVEWINGLPPVGVECEMAREGEMFQAGQLLFRGKQIFVFKWSDNNNEIALRYHQVKFRPIKSPEQVADEKRKKWAHSLCNLTSDKLPLEEAERIYDALLSGELESPKEGD